MFTAVFVSLVSANCTDDQIQTYFTSSKRPWNNYHRISQAVFPPSQLPSLLIKIRVKFVNESSASNSTDVCDEDPNENDKIYMWSMACLYVIPGMISMFAMRVLSLWTIFPNRRQAELCVKLPLLCQCDLQKQEKMKYFLSKACVPFCCCCLYTITLLAEPPSLSPAANAGVGRDKGTGMAHPSSWMSGKSMKVHEVVGRAFFLFPLFQLGRVKVALQAG